MLSSINLPPITELLVLSKMISAAAILYDIVPIRHFELLIEPLIYIFFQQLLEKSPNFSIFIL